MPERDYFLFAQDILEAARKIQRYVQGLSFEEFTEDEMRVDAVVRNFMVIGEAAGRIPEDWRERHPFVEWPKLKALRNVLVHEYFGVDNEVLWDIIRNHLPRLRQDMERILDTEGDT